MTLKGGTSQACAACKYQRRRCSPECPLAPYFPPDQPKMFQNAHKLFGVSNILKILKQLNTVQKMEAMRSIIYQANIRDRFPVHGCCWVMSQLQYQIQQAEEELYAVLAQIAFFQQQKQQQQQQEINNNNNVNDSASQLQALSLFHQEAPVNADASALPIASSYPNVAAAYSSGYPDHKDNLVNSFWEYDEMHPFFDTIDDRQSYIDSKEAYDSRYVHNCDVIVDDSKEYPSGSDSSLKDTTQSVEHIADNELKSAAACFSLTSVN
ncbi:LOB domain-containing protein [Actinidia chinensis var. chinensis]|uniref:LOB domain-containing protein n=1 Tax=Actinidia chinensis var. chinensis TaxID=1590841 RepID=A0A2R6QGX2_ACTCC|nr:LOB domain-containing protein [Actinidia chinensis var. chinensis]